MSEQGFTGTEPTASNREPVVLALAQAKLRSWIESASSVLVSLSLLERERERVGERVTLLPDPLSPRASQHGTRGSISIFGPRQHINLPPSPPHVIARPEREMPRERDVSRRGVPNPPTSVFTSYGGALTSRIHLPALKR